MTNTEKHLTICSELNALEFQKQTAICKGDREINLLGEGENNG